VSSFVKALHPQETSSTLKEWVPFINLNNSTRFCGSKAAVFLTQFLCTLSEADFNVLSLYSDEYSDDREPIKLPPEFALFVQNLRNNVLEKTEQTKKDNIVKWVNCFIFEMINATNNKDGSWPGESHALVLSKMLKIRIVFIDNSWTGLQNRFDSDNGFIEDTPALSDTISRPAPKDQKTCYLYRVHSKYSPYTREWQNAMNHFEYLWETSVHTNDDKQRTYKGRGGIDEHCYPFDLCD